MMKLFPYTPVIGSGLGINDSSLKRTENFVTSSSFGAANIGVYPNLANGNLFIKDHESTAVEMFGQLHLGFVYNHQAKKPWKLPFRQIKSPSDNKKALIVIEPDGHEAIYQYNLVL